MRYFIFTILLVVPLLLTAQSKKEQIATLNLRVDSLSEVLVNVRLNNEKTLTNKKNYIYRLSQEKSDLEKSIVQINQEKLSLETEVSLKNSSLDTMQVQLHLAQDEIAKLLTDLRYCNANIRGCAHTAFMKFKEFNPGVEWEGFLYFEGIAEGGWGDSWDLRISWGDPDRETFNPNSLIVGQIYVVSFKLSYDDVGYSGFSFIDSRNATIEEINEINQQFLDY